MPNNWRKIDTTGVSRPASPQDGPTEQRVGRPESDALAQLAQPTRGLKDVILPEATLERVATVLRLVRHRKKLMDGWGLRRLFPHLSGTALNLYGPPGTGKTLCAEALAYELGRPLLVADYAEIESKYVGDTPKNIVRCFEEAEQAQAVLFFDEADSILGSRLSSVSQSADHGVNVSRAVMLKQLETFRGLVVFATNLPKNYDPAFRRRILAHVEFALPDRATLERLWRALIPAEYPTAPDVDLEDLAARSGGLTGADIANALLGAAGVAIDRADEKRSVGQKDLIAQIEMVQSARREVGKNSASTITAVTEEERDLIPASGVPVDVPA